MMELSLKQFVPSEVCLKCDGCCRYKEADSAWRPKLGADDQKKLAALIAANDVLDSRGYIKTIQTCEGHSCRFLNGADNTCGIYTKRPFECSLYPFILSQTSDAVKVYAHLSCPYIQDQLPSADFDAYAAYLKEFFRRADIREFLSHNKAMAHDYSPYAPELLHLFDFSFNEFL
jgi:Fe-S-cluster containining protein